MAFSGVLSMVKRFWSGANNTGSGLIVTGQMVPTKAGEPISRVNAETLSAVWCATRVISEGMASLPLNLCQRIGDKGSKTASKHPLWRTLHDEPCYGMDSFTWMDLMIQNQINGGDAFAEIVRGDDGRISLYPIDPDKVVGWEKGPVKDSGGTEIGKENERVWFIRVSGTEQLAIPASEILHVPGVIGSDGVRGKSHILYAAEALGINLGMERHVGSFFRQGATPDFAVITKAKVPLEEQETLRKTFRERMSGSANAHKALLLFGDTEVKTIGVNPDDAQLLDSRRFGVEEVSRFWRVPKHFLSSMDQATYNNVELLDLAFLKYTLTPWIRRWELALNRQLLSEEEKQKYFFKFNLNGLMRGDSASRSQFYQRMLDIGCLSIDEIRELEDMNPLPNEMGERYFITANNRIPLDRVDDLSLLSSSKSESGDESKSADAVAQDSAESATATAMAAMKLEEPVSVSVEPDNVVIPVSSPDATATEGLRTAAMTLLENAIASMISFEANRMRRAAEKPREFEARCEEWYSGPFAEKFREVVSPVVNASATVGATMTGEELAVQHISSSRDALMALLDTPIQEFTATVNAVVDTWDARAAVEAREVFAESTQGA